MVDKAAPSNTGEEAVAPSLPSQASLSASSKARQAGEGKQGQPPPRQPSRGTVAGPGPAGKAAPEGDKASVREGGARPSEAQGRARAGPMAAPEALRAW